MTENDRKTGKVSIFGKSVRFREKCPISGKMGVLFEFRSSFVRLLFDSCSIICQGKNEGQKPVFAWNAFSQTNTRTTLHQNPVKIRFPSFLSAVDLPWNGDNPESKNKKGCLLRDILFNQFKFRNL